MCVSKRRVYVVDSKELSVYICVPDNVLIYTKGKPLRYPDIRMAGGNHNSKKIRC